MENIKINPREGKGRGGEGRGGEGREEKGRGLTWLLSGSQREGSTPGFPVTVGSPLNIPRIFHHGNRVKKCIKHNSALELRLCKEDNNIREGRIAVKENLTDDIRANVG